MPPFDSEAQRRLFHAARRDPKVRRKYGISAGAARKMTDHDTGGKLKERAGMGTGGRKGKGAYLSKYD